MSKTPLNLTRNQISAIVGDNPRAVRAFELLIQQVNDILPSDVTTIINLIQEASIEAGTADAKAVAATDAINRLASAVEQLAARPLPALGSMAELSDVYAPTPTDGDKLIYNGTNSRWEKDSRSYLMLE